MKPARLDVLIWVLIYGGLLTLVLGVFIARQDANDSNALGATVMSIGGAVALLGAVLVYVRSRIRDEPSKQAEPQQR